MSVVPRLLRIAANAGSGKTFALSGRYLALVRDGATPGEILATTFTRKAAGEIRDRVLGRLASAAIDPEKLEELQASLPGATAAGAIALLERLVAHLDRLQIRTLDSFFASVALVSAGELGLPSDAQPIDPALDAALATGAIARAADGDRESVVATFDAITKGRAKSMLSDTIKRATFGLEALWRDSAPYAWRWDRRPSLDRTAMIALIERLRAARVHARGGLLTEIERDIAELPTLAPSDPFVWDARSGKGILKKALANDWSFKRHQLHPELIAIYRELVAHVQALDWNELVRRTEATATLLAAYVAALDEMRRGLGVVTFDDITRAVAGAADGEMSELFFRLDGRIAHLLLDEFQDTSATQWRALRPIAGEIVAQDERTLFVVGDLKQSIYRWRGASPDIMEALEGSINEGNVPIESGALVDSYRSSPDVLWAVDEVFGSLDSNPALTAPDNAPRYLPAARRWSERYARHKAMRDFPGVVELHATKRGADAKELLELALDHAADLVEELTRAAPSASIGVLAWRTQAVTGVLRRLRDRGIPASGMGRGALTDAPIVNAMLAALRFAQHPEDTIACFHASRPPLGPLLELDPALHRAPPVRLGDESARLRAQLWKDGPAECVQRWSRALDGHVDAREARRLEQLVEGLAAIESSGGEAIGVVDLDRVVDALRSLDVEEPGGGSVEVLTVHRAKGLEFDLVVVVDLGKMFKVDDAIAWRRATPSGPIVSALRWPGADSTIAEARDLVDVSIESRYREALSTLYVALTRAKRGLFAITAPVELNDQGDPKWKETMAHVLRAAWSPNDLDAPCVRVRGDRRALASDIETALAPTPSQRLPNFALAPRQQRWEVAARAASDISRFVSLDLDADLERDRGIAAHAALAEIEWDTPSSDDLLRASRTAAPRRDETWHREIVAMVERAIASDALREYFKQSSLFPPEREFRFARVLADEGVQLGSIDRIVRSQDSKGRSIATIIDFKSGVIGAEKAEEHARRYRPQLAAYREAVVERFGLKPKDVRCVIAFLEPALAVDIALE